MIRASGHAIATAACRHTHRPQQHSFSPSGQKVTGMSPQPQPEAKFLLTWANTPKKPGLCDPAPGQPWHCSPAHTGSSRRTGHPRAPARLRMGVGVWTVPLRDFRGGCGSVLKGLTTWMQMCLYLPPLQKTEPSVFLTGSCTTQKTQICFGTWSCFCLNQAIQSNPSMLAFLMPYFIATLIPILTLH